MALSYLYPAGQPAAKTQSGFASAQLAGGSPNPFNPQTSIAFTLAEPERVSLTVYSAAGQVVRRLLRGATLSAGAHRVEWRGRDDRGVPVASGVYLVRLERSEEVLSSKVTLLR